MIVVTTLKGERLAINDQLIERVEDDNETRIILTSGARYIVAESVDEIVRLTRQDRAEVHAMARRLAARIDAEPTQSSAGAAGEHREENIVRLDRRTPSDGSG